MSAGPDAFMPLYIGDYLRDTTRLTTLEHGAYVLLLMDAWVNGPTPDNDQVLASITKTSPSQWRKLRDTLAAYFDIEDGHWHQQRVEKERAKAVWLVNAKKTSGTLGAETRWGTGGKQTRSERLAAARAKGCHTPSEWLAMLDVFPGCVRCGILHAKLHGGKCLKDHIKPIYQGGDDSIENIQPMCRNCNSAKGPEAVDHRSKAVPDWRKRLAERLAERLANASQTPTPSQPPSPSQAKPLATEPYDPRAPVDALCAELGITVTDNPKRLDWPGKLHDWLAKGGDIRDLLAAAKKAKERGDSEKPIAWFFAVSEDFKTQRIAKEGASKQEAYEWRMRFLQNYNLPLPDDSVGKMEGVPSRFVDGKWVTEGCWRWIKNTSGNGVWEDVFGVGPPPHDPHTLVTEKELDFYPGARAMRDKIRGASH